MDFLRLSLCLSRSRSKVIITASWAERGGGEWNYCKIQPSVGRGGRFWAWHDAEKQRQGFFVSVHLTAVFFCVSFYFFLDVSPSFILWAAWELLQVSPLPLFVPFYIFFPASLVIKTSKLPACKYICYCMSVLVFVHSLALCISA